MAGTEGVSDVVFLLGAGASKAAGVPDTLEFATQFRASLPEGSPDRVFLDAVVERLGSWRRRRHGVADVDIELLLETLTRVAERDEDPGLEFCRDAAPLDADVEILFECAG